MPCYQQEYILLFFIVLEKSIFNQTPVLLYGKCKSNDECWESLIEEAYAKLHGSYATLANSFIDDGLVDLTGLTSKKMVINSDKMNNSNEADKLCNILLTNSTLEHNNKNNLFVI